MEWLKQLLEGDPLELDENPPVRLCVQCGFCCKQTHCGFGRWNAEKKQCTELIDNEDGTYGCGRYEEILAMPPERWYLAPAFGFGCCAPINTFREAIVRRCESGT